MHIYKHLCCFDSTGRWKKFLDSFVWDHGWSQHLHLALLISFLMILKWNIERNESSEKMRFKTLSETSARLFGLLELYFLYALFQDDLFCYRKRLLTFDTYRCYPSSWNIKRDTNKRYLSSLDIKRDYFLGQR